MSASLLRYENFSLSFGSGRREKFAVRDLSLEIGMGERIALVGESGSGKTLTALSPLRLQPEGAHSTGKIFWRRADGIEVNLLDLSLEEIREVRGREIAMISMCAGWRILLGMLPPTGKGVSISPVVPQPFWRNCGHIYTG